jgi:hypothetical protein
VQSVPVFMALLLVSRLLEVSLIDAVVIILPVFIGIGCLLLLVLLRDRNAQCR